jgi:TPR repeat protein
MRLGWVMMFSYRPSRQVRKKYGKLKHVALRIPVKKLLILLMVLTLPAYAGFDEGIAAYDSGNYETALREFRILAEQGKALAQDYLGVMYDKGQGVPQDHAEAVKWYRKAAEQGLGGAQTNLGLMYDRGKGVAQNYAEAVKWYRKAAEQGNAKAQAGLGVMYGKGQGVPQDHVFAHMWFNLSAAQGGEDARKNRDIAAELMTPEQIAQAQKLARDWKPCGKDRQCP